MEAGGSVTTIAERWQGKRLNRPNDVVCRSDGSIFFTDPELSLPAELRETGFPGVYRISSDGELHLANNECEYPNGLAFSPDESILYVAVSRLDERCYEEDKRNEVCTHRRVQAFDVAPDGSLSNSRIFLDMSSAEAGVSDGIKVDVMGRVFCCGSGGVWVVDSDGNRLGVIRSPEVPRNVAFGGPDFRTLYMTARTSLYSLRVSTPGIGAFQ